MEKQLRILLLEDSIDDVALIEHHLKKEKINFTSRVVDTREQYKKQLEEFLPDVIISDHSLPQFNSLEALELFLKYKRSRNLSASFVLVTGTVSEEFAVKAIQSGADDYILKDRLKRLPSAVLNSVEKNRMKVQKREEEEEKLHLLDILQKSLHETFVVDIETSKFRYVNEQGLKNLGYSLEEMRKLTPAEIIFNFSEERLRKILSKVEKSKKGRIFQLYAVRKNRTRYPIQIHLEIIQQGGKKVALFNCLDISEAKEHEKQKEIALFIQNSFTEKRDLEASLKIILQELCSRSSVPCAEIWGKDFGENSRRYASWQQSGHPVPETGRLLAEKVFDTGVTVECTDLWKQNLVEKDLLLIEKNYTGSKAYPVKSGDEITAVIIFFFQRINEDKDLFVNLREGVQDKLAGNIKRKKTEEELHKVFELSPDILAIFGKDGYIRKTNPAIQKILGYSPEEMTKKSFFELLHPDDRNLLEDWRNRELKYNEVAYYEVRWLSANGTYRHIAWSVTPFLKGTLQYAVGKDITKHKEQIYSIQEQNNRLEEIAWEQSHTVRAPLTRLMACIAYLEQGGEKREEILKSIQASAYELDAIIKNIVEKTEKIF